MLEALRVSFHCVAVFTSRSYSSSCNLFNGVDLAVVEGCTGIFFVHSDDDLVTYLEVMRSDVASFSLIYAECVVP